MTQSGKTRRTFLRDASVAGAGLAASTGLGRTAAALAAGRSRQAVAILGGGVAGLSAAHELAERGFDVTVYERRAGGWGGKARSMDVPNSGTRGRKDLPGEHAFRSYFGLYRNLPDTLKRIPRPGGGTVHDNLVATSAITVGRNGGREDWVVPLVRHSRPQPLTVDGLVREIVAVLQTFGPVPPHELAFFARQLAIMFTSSDERRLGEWERVSWWDYIRADEMSPDYRAIANIVPRAVALRPRRSSARSVGLYWQNTLSFVTGEGQMGGADQVMIAPTNEAWIDPWRAHLRSIGVRLEQREVTALDVAGGRIVAARVRDDAGHESSVAADWFVCAIPVERARTLFSPAIRALDPRLARLDQIDTVWCNGMQFYLRRPVSIVRGHYFAIDSPWALGAVTHGQFWPVDFAARYGDGAVRDVLSMYICEYDEPGIVFGKTARECTPDEHAREVWMQLKAHLEDTGQRVLPDDILHSWFIDPGLRLRGPGQPVAENDDALYLTSPGSWENRPTSATAIPNLAMAGDYTQTSIDAATMEGANESGRRAANVVLERSGSNAGRVPIIPLYGYPEFGPAREVDAALYRRGRPNVLDTPWP
ncbi:MAG: hypothetical protein QOI98_1366 [Solirubrobacteraceae bacterium]|nr:hypothetical protein [Solirubrobacteraceae bacterium]